MLFWYCGKSFLIHLYFTIDKNCSGKLYVIYYPPGRDWGDPTTISVSVYYLYKSWFRSVRTALWCGVTLTRESCITALSRCPKITEDLYFSLFLGGHTHNKTLSCRTTEGWEDSGHYLAKEDYNSGCIRILYISFKKRHSPGIEQILSGKIICGIILCHLYYSQSGYFMSITVCSLYPLSHYVYIYTKREATRYHLFDQH